jgi:hypothetical protein
MIQQIHSGTELVFSARSQPLSRVEMSGAPDAIHRILVVGRMMAYDEEPPAKLAEVFDAVEILPRMLLNPAEFDDLFVPILDGLADKFQGMRGIRDEYLAAIA